MIAMSINDFSLNELFFKFNNKYKFHPNLGNSIFIFFSVIISNLLGFIFLTILARVMVQSDFGEVMYIINIAMLGSTLITSSIPTSMTFFLAKYKDQPDLMEKYFSSTVSIFFSLLVVGELIMAKIYWNESTIILVAFGYSIPLIYMGIMRGLMQYIKYSMTTIATNIIKLIVLLALIYSIGITSINAIIIYSFASWIAIFLLEYIWPLSIKFKIKNISKQAIYDVIHFSMPVALTVIGYSVICNCPVIFLKWFWDYQAIGVYSSASTLSMVYSFIPITISTMIMPKIASEETSKIKNVFFNSIYIVIFTGIFLFVVTILIGNWTLTLLFTTKYEQSYGPLLILAFASIFIGIRNVFSALWEGSGHPVISTYDTCGGSIITIVASLLMIPSHGPMGAAIAFTIGWMASVIISIYFVIKLDFPPTKSG